MECGPQQTSGYVRVSESRVVSVVSNNATELYQRPCSIRIESTGVNADARHHLGLTRVRFQSLGSDTVIAGGMAFGHTGTNDCRPAESNAGIPSAGTWTVRGARRRSRSAERHTPAHSEIGSKDKRRESHLSHACMSFHRHALRQQDPATEEFRSVSSSTNLETAKLASVFSEEGRL